MATLKGSEPRPLRNQFLIFDADDTLWENNIYFEEAFEQFCSFLAHSSLSPADVRAVLDEIETVNSKIHGYGSRNFANNLAACYRHLAERTIDEYDLAKVMEFAHQILERPIELMPGVAETIAELGGRHHLTLFTKGDPAEQQQKIDRSGLSAHFARAVIVKEKNEAAYLQLSRDCGFHPERTWMIGNSPKSDIRPALSAGMNAIFIPHPRTWGLELMDLPDSHPRLLRIETFRELRNLF